MNSQESIGFAAPVELIGDGGQVCDESRTVVPNCSAPVALMVDGGKVSFSDMVKIMRIAESFTSQQGEGMLTDTRSFFIRTSGCNLRCWFCDTPYASWQPEGESVSLEKLVADAVSSGCDHVVLTGGEPLLPMQSVHLVSSLREAGLHVTVETAGTVFRPITADLISISPKLAGSGPRSERQGNEKWAARHEQARWRPEVIRQLINESIDYQIKFVVDAPEDFSQCLNAAAELSVPVDHVWIMPQGIDVPSLNQQAKWLRPKVEAAGFHYCDRMHVRWYGNKRGT